MLKRRAEQQLLEWKNNPNHKCLLVKGARQVGKTYIIDKFCKENYQSYVYINFHENPECKEIFEGSLNVDEIIKQIKLLFLDFDIVQNNTVVFLDEIQECPKAITALKFISIGKSFDCIASGSLLGINVKEVPSFPVGYVEHLKMYSLDFEEFCWANGIDEEKILNIKTYFDNIKEVPLFIHNQMLNLFKEYIVVGGMPEVVQEFVENKDFGNVLKIQKRIVEDYESDIALYAEGTEKVKARECFLSIPKHLAKDYKKFQYSLVSQNGNARKYAGSLMWLYDAGIINFCYNLAKPELPLEGNAKNDAFKVYMCDTGLLMAMLEDGSQQDILNGNLGIYKGAIYENIIADIFTKKDKKIYYFEYNSTLEIDFFIRYNNKATAIEVKAADNTKSKSLTSVINNWHVEQGIRLSTKNVGRKDKIVSYPLYMAMFL